MRNESYPRDRSLSANGDRRTVDKIKKRCNLNTLVYSHRAIAKSKINVVRLLAWRVSEEMSVKTTTPLAFGGTQFACCNVFTSCLCNSGVAAVANFGCQRLNGPPSTSVTIPPASRTIRTPAATSQAFTLVAQ